MVQCSAGRKGEALPWPELAAATGQLQHCIQCSVLSAQLITAQSQTLAADMDEVVARLEAIVAKIGKCGAQGPQLGQVTWCRCWSVG